MTGMGRSARGRRAIATESGRAPSRATQRGPWRRGERAPRCLLRSGDVRKTRCTTATLDRLLVRDSGRARRVEEQREEARGEGRQLDFQRGRAPGGTEAAGSQPVTWSWQWMRWAPLSAAAFGPTRPGLVSV